MIAVAASPIRAPSARSGVAPLRVAFAGGRSGIGTSTTAALFASALASLAPPVFLIDRSASRGAESLALAGWRGGSPGGTPGAAEPAGAEPRVVRLPQGVEVVSGSGSSSPEDVTLLEGTGHHVYDAGASLRSVLAVVSSGLDVLVVLATEERGAAAGAYALFKLASERQPELRTAILLVSANPGGSEPFHRIRGAGRTFLDREPEFAGSVPHDRSLQTALEGGMPLSEAAAGSAAAAACLDLAVRITGSAGDSMGSPIGSRTTHWR